MPHVVDLPKMLQDEWLTAAQADEIARRSRETMVALAVNAVLCAGILAATLGLIFWLADAAAVALAGALFLALGAAVLAKAGALYRMLGNAAAIIGAGMLIGGAGIELLDNWRAFAEPAMILGGLLVTGLAWLALARGPEPARFASGAVLLMGAALHLFGVALAADGASGLVPVLVNGYTALVIAGAGALVNVRAVTALAIVPFAQMLDTGTAYFHAAYVFYSPEPTLTILQMGALIAACLWLATRLDDRFGRHAGILAIMAAVVGNLAFLVGSLWGDTVGASFFTFAGDPTLGWEEQSAARAAFEAQLFHISEHVFAVAWALLLAGAAFWAAHANRRGLFNAAMTFAGIHAYTQVFETLGDEPLVWALGGLAAVPLAWGMWRLNQHLASRTPALS